MEEDKEREDKKREGIVDRLNNAYQNYEALKSLRSLLKFGRAGATAAEVGEVGAAAALTSEVWVPLLIIIGVVLLIIIFVIIILGLSNTKPTSTPSTTTGNVIPGQVSSAPLSLAADQVTIQIENLCGSTMNMDNFNCLTSSSISPQAISELQNYQYLQYGYNYLQCIEFVNAAAIETTGQTIGALPDLNAIQYEYYPLVNYTFMEKHTSTIQPGDIVIYNSIYGAFGHIAIVTNVYSQSAFDVEEANYYSQGQVDKRPDYIDNPALDGWLRKQ
jgi:surface antigen